MAEARQEPRAVPAADREIVISQVIDAPRELVFEGGQQTLASLAAYVTGLARTGAEG